MTGMNRWQLDARNYFPIDAHETQQAVVVTSWLKGLLEMRMNWIAVLLGMIILLNPRLPWCLGNFTYSYLGIHSTHQSAKMGFAYCHLPNFSKLSQQVSLCDHSTTKTANWMTIYQIEPYGSTRGSREVWGILRGQISCMLRSWQEAVCAVKTYQYANWAHLYVVRIFVHAFAEFKTSRF